MAFKHQQCVIIICDVCGTTDDCADFVPHFDTEADALESIDTFDCGWGIFNGAHWCPQCNPPCSNCVNEPHYFGDHEYGAEGCGECNCNAYVLPELPLK